MESTIYIHPAPTLARQIQRLLWMSVGFSILALTFSLCLLGQVSLWITPATFLFCISHNITLLALSAKERKQTAQNRMGKFPATATKASIICSWILVFPWCGAVITIILITLYAEGGLESAFVRIIPWFECAFVVFEVITMIALAVMCKKERHAVAGNTKSAKWHQLGPYHVESQ